MTSARLVNRPIWLLVLLSVCLALGTTNARTVPRAPTEPTLLFYSFQEPGTTIRAANPSGNEALSFGDIVVLESVLRETKNEGSKVIGYSPAWATVNRRPGYFNFQVSLTLTGRGSIILFANDAVISPGVKEYAVLGGTGEFRLAQGVATTEIIAQNKFEIKVYLV